MKRLILISILTLTILIAQDRSQIFNTGNPYYTCNNAGGTYANYTCDNTCDQLAGDYCTILIDGYLIDENNTLADKFTVNENYALEAFGIYLSLNPDGNPALQHTATIQIHLDDNNYPGEILGEWNIDVSTGYYHSLYVGDGCINLENGSSYWLSAHVDYSHTELIWLYTQYPFYTFAQTDNNGVTWSNPEYGIAGAAAIWAEQIYEDAISLSKSGAFAIVIECVVENLARKITQNVSIPTIGIGASKHCDGQVLVADDMIGLSDFKPKFVKQYSQIKKIIEKSVKNYCIDVKNRRFPSSQNVYKV